MLTITLAEFTDQMFCKHLKPFHFSDEDLKSMYWTADVCAIFLLSDPQRPNWVPENFQKETR